MKDIWKNTLKRFSGLALIYPVLLFQTSLEPQDNLTIFNRLASNAARRIVSQASPDSSLKITIQSLSRQQAGNWWFENWLVTELRNRNVTKIHVNQQGNVEEGLIIEFRINDLSVNYLAINDKDVINRQFNINLDVRLLQGETGFVNLLDNVTEQFADTVQVKIIAQLQDESYPFTCANAPEKFGIQKYVEPFVILGATAGVIYLFFRLRSK